MNAVPTPKVTYTDAAEAPVVGKSIRVCVLDHPRFPAGTWICTSRITYVHGERFLTKNTAYIPGVRDDDDPRNDYLTVPRPATKGRVRVNLPPRYTIGKKV